MGEGAIQANGLTAKQSFKDLFLRSFEQEYTSLAINSFSHVGQSQGYQMHFWLFDCDQSFE